MTPLQVTVLVLAISVVVGCAAVVRGIIRRNMHLWLPSQLRQWAQGHWSGRRNPASPLHVFICIADHFEPNWGGAGDLESDARVEAWIKEYPSSLGSFRDSDGRPPQHTFFYPIDEYVPRHVEAIAGLCRQGFGEVEIHLHHDRDTAENLERTLQKFVRVFSDEHGMLSRWPDGRPAYGFVHGNWALDNSRPDGRWCGVTNEISVLERTGCYADFTLPSAPDATQTRTINSIYYASGREACCKSHDRGIASRVGETATKGLLLIQGPLRLWWPRLFGRPRVENGCVQQGQAPSMRRLDQWIQAGVRVQGRQDWVFVKLHTHGAKEENRRVLLGEAGVAFHQSLAQRAAREPAFFYHYVTAREMFNLVKAAETGWSGSVIDARNYAISKNGPDNAGKNHGSLQMNRLRPTG